METIFSYPAIQNAEQQLETKGYIIIQQNNPHAIDFYKETGMGREDFTGLSFSTDLEDLVKGIMSYTGHETYEVTSDEFYYEVEEGVLPVVVKIYEEE